MDDKDSEELSATQNLIDLLFDPGQWIRFPIKLTAVMSVQELVLFSELFNRSITTKARTTNNGWFKYSVEDLKSRVNFSEDSQRRTMDRLVEHGVVEVQRMGNPPFRFIRIISKRVLAMLEVEYPVPCKGAGYSKNAGLAATAQTNSNPAPLQGSNPAPLQDSLYVKKVNNKELSRPVRERDGSLVGGGFFGSDTSVESDSIQKTLANNLYDGLVRNGKITKVPKLSSWAATIKKFFEITPFTPSEFNEVMSQYLARMNEEFMPVAYCAESFCSKFPKIKNALSRGGNQLESSVDRVARLLEKRE